MECSHCEDDISKEVADYSIKNYGRPLCRDCQKNYGPLKQKFQKKQKKSTSEAKKLYESLIRMGINAKLEQWDGYKHIDIAIPDCRVNIEVDGKQHHNRKQALADLKRTFHSWKKGYVTLRVPNQLVVKNIDETAEYIVKFLKESEAQLDKEVEEDDENWTDDLFKLASKASSIFSKRFKFVD